MQSACCLIWIQAQLREAQSKAEGRSSALQANLAALQQQLGLAKAELAAAEKKVQELQQLLQAQQAQQAQQEQRWASQLEQLKMDVSSSMHDDQMCALLCK